MKLTPEQIQAFIHDGILVVPGVIDSSSIHQVRRQFHRFLSEKVGCDVERLEETAKALTSLSSTGGAGGVLDVFYEDWKLTLNQDPSVFEIISTLWRHTYADSRGTDFSHPYGDFDARKGLMAIDRVCFRVPEVISERFSTQKGRKVQHLQRSLTPHLDCCPHNMYNTEGGSSKRWKPIQAFVALTDNIDANTGGFEAVPGFHRQFNEWTERRPPSKGSTIVPCVGDFTPIRPVEDREVIEQFRHIPCRAGDLVLWDYRIPHANARFNHAPFAREVVYLGFLPYVERNIAFAREQLRKMEAGAAPSGQWGGFTPGRACTFEFSELGRKLMLIDEWNTD